MQPDWWFIGGRSKPGDTTLDAAIRNVKRELGIELTSNRLQPIATYSFAWRMRQQPPQENGTADISVIHALELEDDEAANVVLDENEYVVCVLSSTWRQTAILVLVRHACDVLALCYIPSHVRSDLDVVAATTGTQMLVGGAPETSYEGGRSILH